MPVATYSESSTNTADPARDLMRFLKLHPPARASWNGRFLVVDAAGQVLPERPTVWANRYPVVYRPPPQELTRPPRQPSATPRTETAQTPAIGLAGWLAKLAPWRAANRDAAVLSTLKEAVSDLSPSVTKSRHDPIAAQLTHADDRVDVSHWLPPQAGIFPEIRFGRRWYSTAWLLPIGFVAFIGAIAAAQEIRETSKGQAFIARHPGIAQSAPSVDTGFPPWLRWQHFFNLFLMTFIMRSGVQILADHPRLYWNRDCTPGTEWFRFQRPVPQGRIWTAKDDSVTLPQWLGIPGLRHSIGLARWWHFSVNLLWVLNGTVSYVNLFRTDQWKRLVPMTWDVFPAALSTAIQYASLNFPVDESWTRFNGLQQLSYFATVFVAAPLSVATGLMQAPAISNRLGILGRIVHRQRARSIHFLSLGWFLFFIPAHITMVFVTGLRANLNHMFAGRE